MKNRKIGIRLISCILIVLLMGSLFTSCVKKEETSETTPTTESSKEETKATKTTQPAQPVTIKYWAATSPESPEVAPEALECYKIVEEKTGVKIEWIHIPKGTESEQFNLMIASNDLPDVIFSNWFNYGPDRAIKEEIIIPLDNIISQYAPALNKFLKENPQVAKMMKSDEGHYYSFPYLRGQSLRDVIINGLYMRKDWLDDLGLEPPETIDEWYTVLTAFKNQKDAKIPFGIKSGNLGPITAAWGFNVNNFIVVDGKAVFPPYENVYRDCLSTLKKWVEEGLLVLDVEGLDKEITAGECGAWFTTAGSYVDKVREVDPKFDIVPLKNPVLKKGDTPYIFQRWPYTGRGAAITTQCSKDKHEAIARWLDYAYTEEGYFLDNFGKEGEHYNWVDGKIMPTDIVYNPPEGLSRTKFEARIIRPRNAPGPYYWGDKHLYLHPDALNKDPKNKYEMDADNAWRVGNPSRTWPMVTFSDEEAKKLENYGELWTYISDMMKKFINGEESLDNFDKYKEELKRMGVEELIAIYQAALDRFNNR